MARMMDTYSSESWHATVTENRHHGKPIIHLGGSLGRIEKRRGAAFRRRAGSRVGRKYRR